MASLRGLDRDGRLLFLMRTLRMFGYGFVAVVLVLYLDALGLDALTIGVILTLTLVGDTLISLWLTTHADRLGRRRVLVVGSVLMILAGIAFVLTDWAPLLIAAATIGVLSPTGNEVGPFLAVEQAALSQTIPDARRTATFAWYNLVGYVATATGALGGGLLSQALLDAGIAPDDSYRAVLIGYAAIGLAMAVGFRRVSAAVETPPAAVSDDGITRRLGLGRSKGVVLRLSALFSIDAFGGGFIPQSLMAYWFHLQYGVEPAVLGGIFFGANLLAAVSSLSAARIASRIGLLNTMVVTHLPSNVLLILVPLMPTLPLGDRGPAAAVQPQPDGRPDPPVVRDGRRRPGRALGRRGRYRHRPHDGCRALAVALIAAAGRAGPRGRPVLPGRRAEDRVRPPDLPRPSGACDRRRSGPELARPGTATSPTRLRSCAGTRRAARLDDAEPDPGERR